MTEKRYTYSELNNCQYSVSYTTFEEIYGEENVFHSRICEVNNKKQAQKVVDLLNEQEEEIKQLKEFKNKVFKEINTELNYLTEKAMDNPVNHGRIKALKELKRCVE